MECKMLSFLYHDLRKGKHSYFFINIKDMGIITQSQVSYSVPETSGTKWFCLPDGSLTWPSSITDLQNMWSHPASKVFCQTEVHLPFVGKRKKTSFIYNAQQCAGFNCGDLSKQVFCLGEFFVVVQVFPS